MKTKNTTNDDAAETDTPDDVAGDAAATIQQPLWFAELAPGGDGQGFLEKTARHSLMFVKRLRPVLLVTFDNLSNINDKSPGRVPWAFKFAADQQVSHLGVMANGPFWFRDADLISRMERLAKDGFFQGYDRVVFTGTSMGAFGALVFSSLAPGAHVLAFNPQSTLDTNLVPWEERYLRGRRQDWTLPLGDAQGLLDQAGPVSVFYDPYHEPDKRHFERLQGPNVTAYKCFFSNHKSAVFLRKIDALKTIMTAGMLGKLTPDMFYKLYRRRRDLPWYAGALSAYYADAGRDTMAERVRTAFRAAKGPAAVPATKKRKPPASDEKFTIFTTMKNEGPFILEWIAYHRAIGFTGFTVYTNNCDDGTDKIIMRLEQLGLAKHEVNQLRKHHSPQRKALRASETHPYTQKADWLMCADVDEFLNIRVGDGHLNDLLAATGDVDAISFCWKLFGNGGVVEYQPEFVTEQFLWAAPEDRYPNYRASGMKTMMRNNEKFVRMKIHRPLLAEGAKDLRWVDAGGQEMPTAYHKAKWSAHRGFSHEFARLHHYSVRSIDSFLVKRDRGRTNHINSDQGLDYWRHMNANHEYDDSILKRLPAAKAEYERLLTDPVLADLHRKACDWHIAKIEELQGREGWPEFRVALQETDVGGAARKKAANA